MGGSGSFGSRVEKVADWWVHLEVLMRSSILKSLVICMDCRLEYLLFYLVPRVKSSINLRKSCARTFHPPFQSDTVGSNQRFLMQNT